MVREFFMNIITNFSVALGVILGGAIIGSMGTFLVGKPPLHEMATLAKNLKFWAVVAAIGGTFDTIYKFERGYLDGSFLEIVKQIIFIVSALIGVNTGMMIIQWLTQEDLS
jgi:hypothetical protein